jgi:hypothetical protein
VGEWVGGGGGGVVGELCVAVANWLPACVGDAMGICPPLGRGLKFGFHGLGSQGNPGVCVLFAGRHIAASRLEIFGTQRCHMAGPYVPSPSPSTHSHSLPRLGHSGHAPLPHLVRSPPF